MKDSRSASGYDLTPPSADRLAELCRSLTPEQVRITQHSGTEAPFCGGLLDQKRGGIYACLVCGLPLFSSDAKFDSGTGWPSFHSTVDPEHVREVVDGSHGMVRTEIRCGRCDAHLGHVFPDGPPPSGRRHCLNSDALRFVPEGRDGLPAAAPHGFARAYFGGAEEGTVFAELPGVVDAVRGTIDRATALEVVYDPARTGYRELVERFLQVPIVTGATVFVLDGEQRAIAEGCVASLDAGPPVLDAASFEPSERTT